LGINLFVIVLGDFLLLALLVLNLDLPLQALRTATASALEVLIGITAVYISGFARMESLF